MDKNDNYSLHALDFTKHKMEQKVNEDMFSVALDLSMHPSEPNLSTYVDESQFTVHSNIQTYLNREQRLWDNKMSVAEDLRVLPESSSAERFGCLPSPARKLKGNKMGVRSLKQHELKVNRLIERKMKDYGGQLVTKLFSDYRNDDDNSGNALLSFNFKESPGVHSEDVGYTSAAAFSLDGKHRTFPFAEATDSYSRELLEKHISAFEDNGQNRQTALQSCSETSLSEIARSSFGQSEESCEFQGKQQYDEYARKFSDFLKSTANNRNSEQFPLSSSEVSQADDVDATNILADESSQLDAENSILIQKEACVYAVEDGSLQQSESRLDEEECNDERLVVSKSEISINNNEPNDAENGVTGKRRRKRKVRDFEISELPSTRPKKKKISQVQIIEADASLKSLVVANVFEYQWPQEKNADWFVLQEHITEFLGILSFKRKYPDVFRRSVDISERNYLREHGVVSEMQCDLGLTALKTEDVCEFMSKDYPEKYQEYSKLLSNRRKLAEPVKAIDNASNEKSKLEILLKKSIKATADYNASLMRERYHERRAYFDLQTFEVHYPRVATKPKEPLKIGSYPVSLVPGQYQDYYKRYTPQELNYFPLNTALFSPHKLLKSIFTDPACVGVDDTEDDDSPDNDCISISRGKRDDKRSGSENADSEKQKLSVAISLDTEDSLMMLEESAENSRSSFKESKIVKTPLSYRKPRLSGRKKRRELVSKCVVCNQAERSDDGEVEGLVRCSECSRTGHPTCLDLTKEMVDVIRTYPWQCMECKTCVKCMDPHDEEKMMFCDHCDRGYHTFCVGLKSIPEGRWECPSCLDTTIPPKPKRGRPFKYPRPQVTPGDRGQVTPKMDAI